MPDEKQLKPYKTSTLGYDIVVQGPATVEEYDRQAGRAGACLEDAVENTIYRSTLPEIQSAFAKELPALVGGQTRQVNAEATAAAKGRSKTPDKVKDILETVKKFHNRVTAGMSEPDKVALGKFIQQIIDTKGGTEEAPGPILVDPSPSKRQVGIPKEYKAKAESMLLLSDEELESKVAKWGEQYPSIDVTAIERGEDGKPTVESLATTIQSIMQLRMSDL